MPESRRGEREEEEEGEREQLEPINQQKQVFCHAANSLVPHHAWWVGGPLGSLTMNSSSRTSPRDQMSTCSKTHTAPFSPHLFRARAAPTSPTAKRACWPDEGHLTPSRAQALKHSQQTRQLFHEAMHAWGCSYGGHFKGDYGMPARPR